ncbi:membrane lipoprotein lipid attachment site-containing protein [Flavobacterium hungaricum]|uniref:Type IV secretion system putative lipoprotein virB7 n=1 Tax=Flavobacterium hungaricum TaxID=2082725 RepID=A0ABR9TEX1_9FLAO|nr:membrane lipoprotein lipid attachment site-containing protein [Flavobacterium hungaricum]MBE8723898.1 hypothetical protein [Flavobacterium hungaricum]
MKKIFFLIILIAVLSSCQDKKITFVNLEKHSGEGFFDRGDYEGEKFIYKSILVENPPTGDKEILNMLIKYKNQNLKEADINKDAYSFTVFLYEKNNSTSYFIENADDPGGLTSQILQDYYQKNGIGEITFDKCKSDKGSWSSKISYFDKQRNLTDTILYNCKMDKK